MASPPDGEAGHQPCGRVRFHDGEPLHVAVDLSASLPGNKINNNKMLLSSWSILARSHQYIIIFFKDGAMHCLPCARWWRWAGRQRRCTPRWRPASRSPSDCENPPTKCVVKLFKRFLGGRVPRSRQGLGHQGRWFCSFHQLRSVPRTLARVF